jgi:hypothetical protein
MEEVVEYANQILEEIQTYSLPGYAFPMLLIIGFFFLFAGAKICKGVVAGLCFLGGGAAGYLLSDNIVIGVASGVGAAVIGLIVQYVVVVVLAGLAAGGTAMLVAYLLLPEDMVAIVAIGGFLLGLVLAVRLYKILLIFGTSALGAACVAACGLVLLEESLRPEMTQDVELGGIYLDLEKFSIAFFGLLVAGVVVQGIALAHSRIAGEPAR